MATEIYDSDQLEDEAVADLSDSASTTQSLPTSLLNYPVEYGRQYHAYKDGTYTRPNDEAELSRLDLMHALLSLIIEGRLHLAPISHTPHRVLDIGAGSGIWAIEFGDLYPSAQVIGVDLSANLPNYVPLNVQFEVEDVEEAWTFSQPFDYIHSRYMVGAIRDWPKLMSQCFEHLRPGGWVEFADFDQDYYSQDDTLKHDSALQRWRQLFQESVQVNGRTLRPGPDLERWLRDAGFVNVGVFKKIVPVGPWPKDPKLKKLGAYTLTLGHEGLQGSSLRSFTKGLGWTRDAVELLLMEVRQDISNPKIHAMFDYYHVWGQKPETRSSPLD